MNLLLPPIPHYDEPSTGGLALRTFAVLLEYDSDFHDSARRFRGMTPRFFDEPV
jgi:hypothetical protein